MAVGNLEFIKSASGTSVSSLDVTDCFSANYDVYYVTITKSDTANTDYTYGRIINSSGLDSGSNYSYAYLQMTSASSYAEGKSASTTTMTALSFQSTGTADGIGHSFYCFNPYDSSSYTFFTSQSAGFYAGAGLYGFKGIYVHKVAEQVTGLHFNRTGNFDTITVNVYGVK
tara:strand:+ start:55 stop:567 length:513 start_codon:yes stop_codon:yes gene_type:complete